MPNLERKVLILNSLLKICAELVKKQRVIEEA